MENAASDKTFCLKKNVDGELKLKTDHQYYYQVSKLSYKGYYLCI